MCLLSNTQSKKKESYITLDVEMADYYRIKNERELKVCAQSGYNYKSVPAIRLMGQWLEDAGFHIGDPVLVKCEDGKLVISVDTARAELIEAEKAFLEKETRKLQR